MELGYLGPAGTFSEEAANSYLAGRGTARPYPSIPLLLKAAENKEISQALVPLENSLEGSVSPTLSALVTTPLLITAEVILPITHFLAMRPGTKKPKRVLSHPHALAQCSDYMILLMSKSALQQALQLPPDLLQKAMRSLLLSALAGLQSFMD